MIYKKRLKELRERIGITQNELAQDLNIDYKTFSHYENEDVIFPLKHLVIICNKLNVSLDYMFNFTDRKQYDSITKDLDYQEIGKRLKKFRLDNKLTQVKLATKINIAKSMIGAYEHGDYLISTHALYTICKKYNISADYLLGRTNTKNFFPSKKLSN